jgi:hypothetical protein
MVKHDRLLALLDKTPISDETRQRIRDYIYLDFKDEQRRPK